MARKPEIQYIRYYTDGSAARQLELDPLKKKKPVQKKKNVPVRKFYIDPLPVAGIVLSCVLLICMVTGLVELDKAREARHQMYEHVMTLQEKNAELEETYRAGIDEAYVKQYALSVGMIPREQARHIMVQLPPQEEPAQPDLWQRVVHFLTGLFA